VLVDFGLHRPIHSPLADCPDRFGERGGPRLAKVPRARLRYPMPSPPQPASQDGSELFRTAKGNALRVCARPGRATGRIGGAGAYAGWIGVGFFLNEEGYLITNFHVVEGETQISIESVPAKERAAERKIYKQVRIVG